MVAARWNAIGAHRGNGPCGDPTGREVHPRGITRWQIKDVKIQREWTNFNEFGVLMRIFG